MRNKLADRIFSSQVGSDTVPNHVALECVYECDLYSQKTKIEILLLNTIHVFIVHDFVLRKWYEEIKGSRVFVLEEIVFTTKK